MSNTDVLRDYYRLLVQRDQTEILKKYFADEK